MSPVAARSKSNSYKSVVPELLDIVPVEVVPEGVVSAEVVAHAILRLVGEQPACHGRVRCARIICGRAVEEDPARGRTLIPFGIAPDMSITSIVQFVDALLSGRLIAQSPGARPTLLLTLAGFRALEALEAAPASL